MAEITIKRTGEFVRALVGLLMKHPDGLQVREALQALEKLVPPTDYERTFFPSGGLRYEQVVRFATVAPPGKDRGIDILAWSDPLGTRPPRIKIQVKRHEENIRVQDLRSFLAVLDWLLLYQHADRTRDWKSRHCDEFASAVHGVPVDTLWSPDGAKDEVLFAARKPEGSVRGTPRHTGRRV